ncbi:D-glycero-beta-D-manno-heptose 1,7-bisphosphate 7-phosphatase [Candidatus Marithrix sp. Canyon 246]|uniref:D-glycero-beta-D-manno-heptose 1,7-bisphosphate 7-phosphatase n=1 Tax=Candidatus Marithrix sp. Canyon 246 TaxID=1827136 RepID=UPI00084A1E07|nr:D-glycero-beta-D-manno-heptose 1,7-bisphosphate 7-phosphatase [Candidatus Marithrix sp. Canyon 246]
MKKIIILDRDGVINYDSDDFIKSANEWQPLPGSLEAIAKLNHVGYQVFIASNQSGIARGLFTLNELNQIHNKLHQQLAQVNGKIEAIFFCPHGPKDNCLCRKPLPGLFHQIANYVDTTLTDVIAVGDSLRDLQAAKAVAAKPILVLTGKGKRTVNQLVDAVPIYEDLAAVVENLLTDN